MNRFLIKNRACMALNILNVVGYENYEQVKGNVLKNK